MAEEGELYLELEAVEELQVQELQVSAQLVEYKSEGGTVSVRNRAV